jgi:hypothetical protein
MVPVHQSSPVQSKPLGDWTDGLDWYVFITSPEPLVGSVQVEQVRESRAQPAFQISCPLMSSLVESR